MTVKCPTCKGKGHVADGFAWIMLFPVAVCEINDPHGITRDRCPQCKGRGHVTWNDGKDSDDA